MPIVHKSKSMLLLARPPHPGMSNLLSAMSCCIVLRIMESFAVRYHEENPGVFSCSDTAWVLAFGLMMLNTDMYNRNIKVRVGGKWWGWS